MPEAEPMSEIKRKDEERLSPRQAAERLTDIAYALTTGGTLNLGGGQRSLSRLSMRLC